MTNLSYNVTRYKIETDKRVQSFIESLDKAQRARIDRLFLCIEGNTGFVVHAIRKKTQRTPIQDLNLAKKRIAERKQI